MNAYRYLDLTSDEIASFNGEPQQGFIRSFPLTLYRVVGSFFDKDGKQKTSSPRGRFWFDADLFWRLRRAVAAHGTPPGVREEILRWLLRDSLAVCRDWSSLRDIYCLNVRQGPLFAAWGPAAKQGILSKSEGTPVRDEANLTNLLSGGGMQYVIDVRTQGLHNQVKRYDSIRSLVLAGEA